jgi:hypothetical protein
MSYDYTSLHQVNLRWLGRNTSYADKSNCTFNLLGVTLAVMGSTRKFGQRNRTILRSHEHSIKHSSYRHVTLGLGEVGFGVELEELLP